MTQDEQRLRDAVYELMHRFDASGLDDGASLRKIATARAESNGSIYLFDGTKKFRAFNYIAAETEIGENWYTLLWWTDAAVSCDSVKSNCGVNFDNRFRCKPYFNELNNTYTAFENVKRAVEICFFDVRFRFQERIFLKFLEVDVRDFPLLPSTPLRSNPYA